MGKLALLAGGTLVLWAVAVYPCSLVWGETVWLQSAVALALCLVPALVTLAWVLTLGDAGNNQILAVLAGSGIRMMVALGGALLLYKVLPETFTDIFWLWMALFYMFILTLETILVVKRKAN